MDQELAGALVELGLSATEAEIYVALLTFTETGSISAYKLAHKMGRDPANLMKVLAAMSRRGTVRASGRRPRLYAPVAPEDFTSRHIARLQDRQQRALALLRDIGHPPPDQDPIPLSSPKEALSIASRLLSNARIAVLIDGSAALLNSLADALHNAATRPGVRVLASCPDIVEMPEVIVRRARGMESWQSETPGPWLRLAVDGEACLIMLVHPTDNGKLLYGHWSSGPTQVYMAHRNLASELILAELQESLQEGVDSALACSRAAELASLLSHQFAWRRHLHEAGLPDHAPTVAEAAGDGRNGPLQFIHRVIPRKT